MHEYSIPKGMVNAAMHGCGGQLSPRATESLLKAAVEWLSANPIAPQDSLLDDIMDKFPPDQFLRFWGIADIIKVVQERLFLVED